MALKSLPDAVTLIVFINAYANGRDGLRRPRIKYPIRLGEDV
jgi:hypothetical protein